MTAETAGNHYWEDASGRGTWHVAFDLHQKVRYRITAHADSTVGYNASTVTLSSAGGTIFSVAAYQGDWVSGQQTGWLNAGSYTFDADAEVMAWGYHFADSQHGNAESELRIFDAADYDMDGGIDAADKNAFRADQLAGDPEADFDGDGDTDDADWTKFKKAWNQAMN